MPVFVPAVPIAALATTGREGSLAVVLVVEVVEREEVTVVTEAERRFEGSKGVLAAVRGVWEGEREAASQSERYSDIAWSCAGVV